MPLDFLDPSSLLHPLFSFGPPLSFSPVDYALLNLYNDGFLGRELVLLVWSLGSDCSNSSRPFLHGTFQQPGVSESPRLGVSPAKGCSSQGGPHIVYVQRGSLSLSLFPPVPWVTQTFQTQPVGVKRQSSGALFIPGDLSPDE